MPSHFTILRYRRKVPVEGKGVPLKTIVDPQACSSMHYHWRRSMTPEFDKKGTWTTIDPEVGVKFHYKKCHLNEKQCAKLQNQTRMDHIILRFRNPWRERVDVKVNEIVGWNMPSKVAVDPVQISSACKRLTTAEFQLCALGSLIASIVNERWYIL